VNPYRAIVIGATGAVGSSLVRELLASPLCEEVTAVVRQEPHEDFFDDPNSKLRLQVLDMEQLGTEAIAPARNCDAAFCTMGIGQPRKVTKAQFWKVDVEYALAFARACKLAGVKHFSLLSSVGANASSWSNYLHVKGVVEERLGAIGFQRVSLFRPGLLVTKQIRYGMQDRLTQALYPLVSGLLAPKFHQIKVEDVGRAMRINAERSGGSGVESLTYPEFRQLLDVQPQSPKVKSQGQI
jgi:uncharacterized protein YbjT (DUF2867 family)